ncbi:MAG: hypothetical protein PSV35_01265 [bacterium]|nr:hypothetical protein [bacterium]
MLNGSLLIKSIFRELRSGELTLLCVALIIAVSCISAMNNFTYMAQRGLAQGAAKILGADVLLKSKKPIEPAWIKKAKALGISQNITLSLQSMVSYNDHLQLAEIKAINTPYPLQGTMHIANQLIDGIGHSLSSAPEPGTVWLNPRLFPLLAVTIGQSVTIGDASFKVTGVIREEPGQTGDWFTLSPRIFMNNADVAKTKTIQPGSIISYNWLLNGTKVQLEQLHAFLIPQLNARQEWRDSQHQLLNITTIIDKTLSYLNLATLMSLVLAGVAISMASLRYCQRHLKQVALLRCFGASQSLILQLYLGTLALTGIISCILGAAIGYGLQPILIGWLGGLLPYTDHYFSLAPFVLSIATGMLLLFCFSLGTFWQLGKVSAISLFRQQQLSWKKSACITYLLALLLLGGLAFYYTGSLKLTLIVLVSCVLFIILVLVGLWLFFAAPIKTHVLPLTIRFGFNNIARNMADSALQVIGIGLALTTVLSLSLLKNHLFTDWQQQLPAKTPNYFIFNIEPGQKAELQQFLQQNQVYTQQFYPIWRGRLMAINNQSVNTIFGEQVKNINALQRELNLSCSVNVPETNQITQGRWGEADATLPWVSVEQKVGEQLKLKLGDILHFNVDDKEFNVKITSFRQVQWSTFKPNFFMLFKPGLFSNLPQTVITSFYIPAEKQAVLVELSKRFPNASLIDITQTITTLQIILNSASNAITFINSFALLIGLIIVALAILSLSSIKRQETSILKILGMSRNNLLWIRSSEAILIGLYSGFLAAVMAILINKYVVEHILETLYRIPWLLLIVIPLVNALLVLIINLIIQNNQYQQRGSH